MLGSTGSSLLACFSLLSLGCSRRVCHAAELSSPGLCAKLTVALCCCAGSSNPVTAAVLQHLGTHSATSKIIAALTAASWLHASGGTPQTDPSDPPLAAPPSATSTVSQEVVQALLASLALPAVMVSAEGAIQCYSELSGVYSTMQQHAQVMPTVANQQARGISSLSPMHSSAQLQNSILPTDASAL